jgi:hypothetical protein
MMPSSTVQAVRTVWREIQAEEQRMLERVTLADLVQQIEHTNEASYQI